MDLQRTIFKLPLCPKPLSTAKPASGCGSHDYKPRGNGHDLAVQSTIASKARHDVEIDVG